MSETLTVSTAERGFDCYVARPDVVGTYPIIIVLQEIFGVNAGIRSIADNYAADVTAIISDTIERWDGREAADKIELMVGKDLQYIRVNGTIVGALAGLVIYTVTQILF